MSDHSDLLETWIQDLGYDQPDLPWKVHAAKAELRHLVAVAREQGRQEAGPYQYAAWKEEGRIQGQRDALAARLLTADSPEPAIGSVVLFLGGWKAPLATTVAQHWSEDGWYVAGSNHLYDWPHLFVGWDRVTLIHDGGPKDGPLVELSKEGWDHRG